MVGRGGCGLKQITDISSACVSVYLQEINGYWEYLVSVQGTNKQLSDALVVLGKQIAQKHVSVPKKKKNGLASSGPVNAGPGPLCQVALPQPSAPPPQSSACQMTTPTCSQARPSVASQSKAQPPSLLPPTPSSRTVVMASPFHSTSRNWTPTVPSVCIASPEPLRSRNDLTSMEVDHILVLVGSDLTSLLPLERRD